MKKYYFSAEEFMKLKGAVLLSEVHNILRKNNVKVVSILAGENIHGERCLKEGDNKIRLIGHVKESQVAELYNICDLFVFPQSMKLDLKLFWKQKLAEQFVLYHQMEVVKELKKMVWME